MSRWVCSSIRVAGFLLFSISMVAAQTATGKASAPRVSLPVDWSSHRLMYHHAPDATLKPEDQMNPRSVYSWLRSRPSKPSATSSAAGNPAAAPKPVKIDWSFPLGAGTVPKGMYPAKWTFNINAAADCTNDYAVFGLNVAGSATQPNVVRFNNLYSGPGGICNPVNPSVLSAYTINTLDQSGTQPLNGQVLTSPILAQDGSAVAFIEIVTGNTLTCPGLGANGPCSIFHVLKWGTVGNSGSFNILTNTYSAVVPGASDDAVLTSIVYNGVTTRSSPWVDYDSGDHAYWADDSGRLYRTTCTFKCTGGQPPALDAGWPVTVFAGVKLSAPIHDFTSNKVFVGGSNGRLFSVDLATCPGGGCVIGNILVGTGVGAFGGIVDSPLMDQTFGTIFAYAGNNGGNRGTMFETNATFTVPNRRVNMGTLASFDIYAGALDAAYFNNAIGNPAVVGNVFACGPDAALGTSRLYWSKFAKGAGNLSLANPPRLGAVSSVALPGNANLGCSPFTEIKAGPTDRLFLSQSSLPAAQCGAASVAGDGCAMLYNITNPPVTVGAAPAATAVETGGTSAIIVDNVQTGVGQAASVYFAIQTATTAQCAAAFGIAGPQFCAVKLRQPALN